MEIPIFEIFGKNNICLSVFLNVSNPDGKINDKYIFDRDIIDYYRYALERGVDQIRSLRQ